MSSNVAVRKLCDFLETVADAGVSKEVVEAEARSLILFAPFAAVMDHPLSNATSSTQARDELAKFVQLSVRLIEHMDSMHATSLDAIRQTGTQQNSGNLVPYPDPIAVLVNLRKITVSAHEASRRDDFPGATPKPITRPKKNAARQVAVLAAGSFHRVTGKKATIAKRDGRPYGKFYELLRLTFDLVGMRRASAESMGREAIRIIEKSTPKHGR
ncbi:hypothetical protein [Aestuariivirga sp.]|jgi:hypothetical protein|uniref:hypothetical protein n=1 Tax=Aestuariivirga sp. TaxID=2650926 RepID=UPI0037851C8D